VRVGGEEWAPPGGLIAGDRDRREGTGPVFDRLAAALGRRREANATVTRTRRGRTSAGGRYDAVYSARALGTNVALLCLARRDGGPFARRESRIVQLVHSEVGWAYDETPPAPDGLTPRQRECFQCLLAGKSEKRIASDLRLSPHTVHVHVKAIYRQAGVSTRAELMAKFLGGGRRVSRGVGMARAV
jgi:DNA-binding CsgD family transcriptional regulator